MDSTRDHFQKEKNKAMVESTAQSIFNTLRELEGGRLLHQKRWPWELLQNAVDVAKPSGVDCTFVLGENDLVFIHNGNSFEMRDIAHLIYHGSTKTDDQSKIRFGTGFITTHLLSRKPRVKGVLKDGQKFEFELNREGTVWNQLEDNMDRIEQEFIDSIEAEVVLSEEATVEYKYPLSSEGEQSAIVGLEALHTNIPFVLALNENLSSVTVIEKNIETKWLKGDYTEDANGIVKVVAIESTTGEQRKSYSVAIASEGLIQTALLLAKDGPEFYLESMKEVPKLFYGFPLAGTEDFPLAVVINSSTFVPKEKRDGLLLGPYPHDVNIRNKKLIEKALDLFQRLVEWAARIECRGLSQLAMIRDLPEKEWLDSEWLKTLLAKVVVSLEKLDLVETGLTSEGKPKLVSPQSAYIPYDDDAEVLEEIHKLALAFYRGKLPSSDIVEEWAMILNLWGFYLNAEPAMMSEALTLSKLARTTSEFSSLENLQQELEGDPKPEAIEWLNRLLSLLHKKETELLQDHELVPCQQGSFKKTTDLHKDGDIDEALKDVSSLLELGIRDQLCNTRIISEIQDTLPTFTEERLLSEAVNRIKEYVAEEEYSKKEYIDANVTLFSWLAKREKFGTLKDNFPVINRLRDNGESKYVSHLLQEKYLLKPVSLWEKEVESHADVFPRKAILSDVYNTEQMDAESWRKLVSSGLIIDDVFVKQYKMLEDVDIRKLLAGGKLNEHEDHGTNKEIELVSIAFLEEQDWGIINRVRKSKTMAKKFLRFLLEYAVQKDTSWMNAIPVSCSCDEQGIEHEIYPSKWLLVLRSRPWVPISKNIQEFPSTENLVPLFEKEADLLDHLMEDKASSLLSILGVSPSQILIGIQPTETRVQLDKAFVRLLLATESSELNKMAQVYRDPNLRSRLE